MTSSMRQATSKSSSKKGLPSTTTLRVRFPEGVVLQGVFGVKEPCSCVHAWVAQALRFPGSYFELIAPSRQPLPMGGTSIRDVPDIVPSAVLNFRMSGSFTKQGLSNLSDEMLKQTRAE
uniref:UBX domain-containing protein n=2 Tax=Dunaliella tertiolecta TaxID=3047 RepID=A0A7S3R9T9_DUNTE